MAKAQAPRGIRNNNPLNLVHVSANKWQGLASPPTDGRMCRFISPQFGIRAAALNLIAYQDRYGIRTIAGAVGKWAPWNENDVAAYVADVCKRTGINRTKRLDFTTYDDARAVLEAMAWHECGVKPFTDSIWDEGLMMAGIIGTPKGDKAAARPAPVPVPQSASKDRRVVAPSIMTGATLVGQVTAQAQGAWDFLLRVHPWAPHIVLALCGIVAIGAGVVFFVEWLKARRAAVAP